MPDKPLQPFSPPTAFAGHLPAGVNADMLLAWFLYLVLFFWIIYTVVTIYHWIEYSHRPLTAIVSIGVHIFISVVLITFIWL